MIKSNINSSESKSPQPVRKTWDEYFLDIAEMVASRSTCFRNKVGAVIVRDKVIVSTGYNGAPTNQPNCMEIGYCYRDRHQIKSGTQLERCRAVGSHAESNAVVLAARNGQSTAGATIYVVGHKSICDQCKAIIANAKIERVVMRNLDRQIEIVKPSVDWTVHPVDQQNKNS
ncbi:MAG TPA: dCMP deaminase family protein [Candidatus Marinimicrobia bacterium]|nr:dCMP deaminase family protein [Candidatus Neomarinimicrobiota bacterium]HRS52700.1 dCMP deaminase family protein [Candidatus Neomarinimicrobiota bacterium]HRU93285.1 dCMP deaminase family protein [Candidatus Neomarinimicrobiota bacterium]